MYSCESTCKNCGHITLANEDQLWRIVGIANDLEVELREEGGKCNICGKVAPLSVVIRNEASSAVVFEKIISPISAIGKSPIPEIKDVKGELLGNTSGFTKPSMDNPCTMCCATGTIQVKYRAHKKEDSFKGLLTEECPICEGKGYFK